MQNRTNYIFLKVVQLFLSFMIALLPLGDATTSNEIILARSTGYIVLCMFLLTIALAIVEILIFYKSNLIIGVLGIVVISIGWAISTYGQSLGNEIIWLFGCIYTIYLIIQIVYLLIRKRIKGIGVADSNLPFGYTNTKSYRLNQSVIILIYLITVIITLVLVISLHFNIYLCYVIGIALFLILQYFWTKQYNKINSEYIRVCIEHADYDSLDNKITELLKNPIHAETRIHLNLLRCSLLAYIDVEEGIKLFRQIELPNQRNNKEIYYNTMLHLALVNQDFEKANSILQSLDDAKKLEGQALIEMLIGSPSQELEDKFKIRDESRVKNMIKAYYLLNYYMRTNNPNICLVARYILDQNTCFNEINNLAKHAFENKN